MGGQCDCCTESTSHISLTYLNSMYCYSRGSWSPCGWAVRLLRRIHFSQVSRWELESCLRRTDQQTTRLVLAETLRQSRHRPHTALSIPSPLVNNRGMELAVVKVGYRCKRFIFCILLLNKELGIPDITSCHRNRHGLL